MRVTRKTNCFSLALALMALTAIFSQPLLGQETLEFEVLTGHEVSHGGGSSFETSSPGDQFDGVSVRRGRVRTRPVSHPNVARLESTGSYVPRHQRIVGRQVGKATVVETVPGKSVYPGKTIYEQTGGMMPMSEPCVDGSCGIAGSCGGGCGGCGDDGCVQCIPCPRFSLKNMQFFAGAHGFLSPRDAFSGQGQNSPLPRSSFGFHGGVNWGFHFPCLSPGIAFQLGAMLTGSNFDGEYSTYDTRSQMFLTSGIFRRVDWGLQGGFVIDYVNDEWYVDHELLQVRGELSWVFRNCFEFGFTFAGSARTSENLADLTAVTQTMPFSETREALDNFRFFVRQKFQRGGEGRLFAGWTEDGDGLVGADVIVPISCDWAVQGGFAYVSPKDDDQQAPRMNVNYDNELWNVSVALVWFPGGFDTLSCKYNRPLFNVADNGSFLQKIIRD